MSRPHLHADRLLDLVDGVLTSAQETSAREHLAHCRDCAAVYRCQREVRAELRVASAPAPDADLMAGLLSLSTGNRLGGGALLPPPPLTDAAPLAMPAAATARQPDTARWVFTAALAGGVSLVALGGASVVSANSGTPLPAARSIVQGVSGQSWASLVTLRTAETENPSDTGR